MSLFSFTVGGVAVKIWSGLVAVVILAACSEPPPPPIPPKVVRVLKVGAGETEDLRVDVRVYAAEVRARLESNLGFRVPGKLVARLVDVGAAVKAGQVLARLDASDAGLQLAQAEAQRDLAEAELRRYRDLRNKGFVSQSALDARETALTAARAQAALAKNQSGYTNLLADRNGVIAAVAAEPGQVLTVGQTVLRLSADGEREVVFSIPESEIAQFKPGMPALVVLWADETHPLPGKIREISPLADPMTHMYTARVSLPGADPRLPLGLSAAVRFELPQRLAGVTAATANDVVTQLPLAAIFQQGKQAAVWKVGADETVSLKPITVASFTPSGALVTQGLTHGDRIVAAGVHKLSEGEKVRLAVAAK